MTDDEVYQIAHQWYNISDEPTADELGQPDNYVDVVHLSDGTVIYEGYTDEYIRVEGDSVVNVEDKQ